MNYPVFDLHCDSAFVLMGDDFAQLGNMRENKHHFDLNRASGFPGYAQCFACVGTTLDTSWSHINPVQFFERQLATIQREIDKNADLIALAYTASDVRRYAEKGKMSAILSVEGPASFGFDPELLPDLYAVGFRLSTLCWNESNPLAGSCYNGGALSDSGAEYVKTAQKCGMIIDVSHCSDETFWDVIRITEKPVVASHSNSRAVFDHCRNLTDDMFRAICETGGTVGLNLFADFLGENASVQDACKHILHWFELDPDGKHISLGADMDGCDRLCGGISGVQDYPCLVSELQKCGLSESNIYDICWNNALGVMEKCCT